MSNLPTKLKRSLKEAKNISLSAEEKSEVYGRILALVEEEKGSNKNTAGSPIGSIWVPWWKEVMARKHSVLVKAGISALFLMLIGGTGLSAEKAVPGDLLYPVKVEVNEPLVGTLTFTSEAKARYAARQIERRLEEVVQLLADNGVPAEWQSEVEHRLTLHTASLNRRMNELEDQDRVNFINDITTRLESQVETHQRVMSEVVAEPSSKVNRLSQVVNDQLESMKKKKLESERRLAAEELELTDREKIQRSAYRSKEEVEQTLAELESLLVGLIDNREVREKVQPEQSEIEPELSEGLPASEEDNGESEAGTGTESGVGIMTMDNEEVAGEEDEEPDRAGDGLDRENDETGRSERLDLEDLQKILSTASSTVSEGEQALESGEYQEATSIFDQESARLKEVLARFKADPRKEKEEKTGESEEGRSPDQGQDEVEVEEQIKEEKEEKAESGSEEAEGEPEELTKEE